MINSTAKLPKIMIIVAACFVCYAPNFATAGTKDSRARGLKIRTTEGRFTESDKGTLEITDSKTLEINKINKRMKTVKNHGRFQEMVDRFMDGKLVVSFPLMLQHYYLFNVIELAKAMTGDLNIQTLSSLARMEGNIQIGNTKVSLKSTSDDRAVASNNLALLIAQMTLQAKGAKEKARGFMNEKLNGFIEVANFRFEDLNASRMDIVPEQLLQIERDKFKEGRKKFLKQAKAYRAALNDLDSNSKPFETVPSLIEYILQ